MCSQGLDHPICTIASIQAFPSLMVFLSMTFPMMLIILQEHVFVPAICRKCNCRNAESWEAALKSVPSREGS